VVSFVSTEAARELGLAPGSLAVAVRKSTQVITEAPNEAVDSHGWGRAAVRHGCPTCTLGGSFIRSHVGSKGERSVLLDDFPRHGPPRHPHVVGWLDQQDGLAI
jgi:hypothetical protein